MRLKRTFSTDNRGGPVSRPPHVRPGWPKPKTRVHRNHSGVPQKFTTGGMHRTSSLSPTCRRANPLSMTDSPARDNPRTSHSRFPPCSMRAEVKKSVSPDRSRNLVRVPPTVDPKTDTIHIQPRLIIVEKSKRLRGGSNLSPRPWPASVSAHTHLRIGSSRRIPPPACETRGHRATIQIIPPPVRRPGIHPRLALVLRLGGLQTLKHIPQHHPASGTVVSSLNAASRSPWLPRSRRRMASALTARRLPESTHSYNASKGRGNSVDIRACCRTSGTIAPKFLRPRTRTESACAHCKISDVTLRSSGSSWSGSI